MFNDERINYKVNSAKKFIIIISIIISSLFLIPKILGLIIYKYQMIGFGNLATEIVMVLTGVSILIGSLFIKSEVKDEEYYNRKANYYKLAFKIYLYIVFITFAICMPWIARKMIDPNLSSNVTINIMLSLTLVLGYSYFKINNIYFNYQIIEEDNRTYFKKVLKNILKILSFFGIVYSVALVHATGYIMTDNFIQILLTIILGFVFSVISCCVYYFIISYLERLYYKQEHKKIITLPSIILLIISFVTLVNCNFFTFVAQVTATSSFLPRFGLSLAQIMAIYNYIIRFFKEINDLVTILSVVFIVTDVTKNNAQIRNKLKPVIYTFLVIMTFSILYSPLQNVIYSIMRYYSGIKVINFISRAMSICRFIFNILAYIFIFIYTLIRLRKELKSKPFIKVMLILYSIYESLMIFVSFTDLEYRTYTSSLIINLIDVILKSIIFIKILLYFKDNKNQISEQEYFEVEL